MIDFIMAGGAVKRYHTLTTLHTQNVAEHSFGVAWLVWWLSDSRPSTELLMAALGHDLAEHITGDLPAPAKRSLGISAQFTAYEDEIMGKAGFPAYWLTVDEKRVLKMADTADLMLFCLREMSLGNRQMRKVFMRGMSYAVELKPHTPKMVELINFIEEKYRECE